MKTDKDLRVLIDDGMQIRVGTGIGKYSSQLYESLKQKIQVCDLNAFPAKKKTWFTRIKYLLYINSLKFKKKLKKYDVVHFTNYLMPLSIPKETKCVVTIHDLTAFSHPETLSFLHRLYFRFIIKFSLKHADLILCISNTIKEEIINRFPKLVRKQKMDVIYCGLPYNSLPTLPPERDNTFLYVGTIEKRKNISLIISAFNLFLAKSNSNYKLVLAGKMGLGSDEIIKEAKASPFSSQIIFTGYISDNKRDELYLNSGCLVFASLYEGFGIPQIESIYFGLPIILSDIPTNREITNNNGLYFKNNDSVSLAKAMTLFSFSKDGQIEKRRKLQPICTSFFYDNLIKNYISSYLYIIDKS